jgi:site-specific recombinase XerD
MQLGEALTLFLADCEFMDLAPTTIVWYERMIRPFADWQGGDVVDVTRSQMKAYLGEYKAGHSAASTRGAVKALRRFFSWAKDEELIDLSPMRKIKAPKRGKRIPKDVTLSDVRMLLATCDNSRAGIRDRAIMILLLDSGIRVGGLLGLRLGDVDAQRMAIIVTEKNGPRYAHIVDTTLGLLGAWLNVRPASESTAFFLALNKHDEALGYSGVRLMLRRRSMEGETSQIVTPHMFRHAFAKQYLLNGGDSFTLSDLLGHSDYATTRNFYAIFEFKELKKPHERFSPTNLGL